MNAQPNSPEHPEETARRSETEHRDIVDNIPATADQGIKLSSQPDVEALRRTEKELRDLVENMPAMAGVLLPDGSHTYLTNQWRRYSGLSVAETDSGGWRPAVHPGEIHSPVEKFRAPAAASKAFQNDVGMRRAVDGE